MKNKDLALNPRLLRYKLPAEVVAFSTGREGGCSVGSYASFNVNSFCGDLPENVLSNRRALCRKLGIDDGALVLPHQVHSDKILIVDETFIRASEEERCALSDGCDAVMTRLRRVCVAVSTADCVPILLYDSNRRVVAAVHSGWRGTVKRIVSTVLRQMELSYGTQPQFVRAVIGPHISLPAFEVGDEVYEAFNTNGFPMPRISERSGGKWHIDLKAANRCLLNESGIPDTRITDAGICCYTESNRYFSARRLGTESGRTLTGIMLV